MKTQKTTYYYSTIGVILAVLGIALALWLSLQQQKTYSVDLDSVYYELETTEMDSSIVPLPQKIDLDERKVSLGERLFHDTRLSQDNSLSCASCHNLNTGGTVHIDKALGMNNQKGERNSPTVFNSMFNIGQFWDGRSKTLEDQIDGPIQSSVEMATNWQGIINKLSQDIEYSHSFTEIYPNGMTSDSIKDAIATFERSLITPNSRFDRYLRGEKNILTSKEISGFEMFQSFGCISCHQGINIGSNLYQTFGVFLDYQEESEMNDKLDVGRFAITGLESDKYVFKVPSLRNIALTAPYFHNGFAETLEEAVKVMGEVQLGRHLNDTEVNTIVSFLKTLTGEYRGKPL